MSDLPCLVLSGGNALGAYHLGAWTAFERAGLTPGWIAGASIGAITAAIIAGNRPGDRTAALTQFWSEAESFDFGTRFLPNMMRAPVQYAQASMSRFLGRTSLFTARPPDLTGQDPRPSMFDLGPMRRLVSDSVDFDRLNDGELRVSVLAVNLATGGEVVFDTSRQRVELHHLMASCSLIPDFPPVEVEGTLLVDGGLSANLPVHLVLDDLGGDTAPRVCFAVDCFPPSAPLPRGLLQAAQRQSDLLFASQSRRTLSHLQRLWAGREPGADVFHLAYSAMKDETVLKGFDFGKATLARRKARGDADMDSQIALWRSLDGSGPGLTIHTFARD